MYPKTWTLVGLCVAVLACDGGSGDGDGGQVGDAGRYSPAQAASVCAPALQHLRTCGVLTPGEIGCDEEGFSDEILCNLGCLNRASCGDLETFACTEGDGPFTGVLGSCLEACDPQLTCDNGEQVDLDRSCDGAPDCLDGSDEVGCPGYECADGTTVNTGARCNGALECPDQSDERGCPGYTCADGMRLSFEDAECDSWEDCSDGSDEVGCPVFDCGNGEEIGLDWQCNGEPDCSNSNDERNCPEEAELLCNGVPVD